MLGTPPAFILSQDQTLNKSYLKASYEALKSDLLIRFPALKRNCLENISALFKNPFLGAYFCISCSYIVQFSRYIPAPLFRGQLAYNSMRRPACQQKVFEFSKIFAAPGPRLRALFLRRPANIPPPRAFVNCFFPNYLKTFPRARILPRKRGKTLPYDGTKA